MNRKLFSAALALACACITIGSHAAEPAAVAATPIYHAKVAPVIDGRLDDACWKNAEPVRVRFLYASQGVQTEPPPMTARFVWDERFLYIGYEVNDTNIVALRYQ